MCTAITFKTKDSYFGRTLDLEYSYDESVVVTPRNFELHFRKNPSIKNHYAFIGMATVADNYPLYYEASNEYGLSAAGLNFPDNAVFSEEKEGNDNVSVFEFIPWILSQCKNIDETKALLERINICNIPFSKEYPVTPLHWIIADKNEAITVESVKEGLKIYENPVGVLTNNPTFDYHITHLEDFSNLTSEEEGKLYSRGLGAKGLPGDNSSTSRFVRVTFTKLNSLSGDSENESVSQFFHVLSSVNQTRGSVRLENGKNVITVYTSCINQDKGIYYYTTYENRCISAVNMNNCDLEGEELFKYPLVKNLIINKQN